MSRAQQDRLAAVAAHIATAATGSASKCATHACSSAVPGRDEGVIDVGSRKQLLFDQRFIADMTGDVEHSMAAPFQHSEPVLRADRPWEDDGIGAYNTVLREGNTWRMWYHASKFLPDNLGGMPAEGACRLCYAESHDGGWNWEKPNLGLVEFGGSTANNIVGPLHERQVRLPHSGTETTSAKKQQRSIWLSPLNC